jgi:hypothetical protein
VLIFEGVAIFPVFFHGTVIGGAVAVHSARLVIVGHVVFHRIV